MKMEPKKIHVLPVGFDINRLTAPLASDEFDVDKVVLLRSTEDDREKTTWTQEQTDQLVSNAFERTKDNIENVLNVPIETRTIPGFTEYRELYAEAYKLLKELSDDGVVYVNVSSLPLSAASAFINAEAVLSSEGVDNDATTSDGEFTEEYANRAERVHTYYIRPKEYLNAKLVGYIRGALDEAEHSLERYVEEYRELESGVFYALGKTIQQRIETLQTLTEDAKQELEMAPPEQRGDDWENNIQRCNELLMEWEDIGPEEPFTGPIMRARELE